MRSCYIAERSSPPSWNTEGFRLDVQDLTVDPSILDELKLHCKSQLDSVEQGLPEALDAVETMLAG